MSIAPFSTAPLPFFNVFAAIVEATRQAIINEVITEAVLQQTGTALTTVETGLVQQGIAEVIDPNTGLSTFTRYTEFTEAGTAFEPIQTIEVSPNAQVPPQIASHSSQIAVSDITSTATGTGVALSILSKGILSTGSLAGATLGGLAACGIGLVGGMDLFTRYPELIKFVYELEKKFGIAPESIDDIDALIEAWKRIGGINYLLNEGKNYIRENVFEKIIDTIYGINSDGEYDPEIDLTRTIADTEAEADPDTGEIDVTGLKGCALDGVTSSGDTWYYPNGAPPFKVQINLDGHTDYYYVCPTMENAQELANQINSGYEYFMADYNGPKTAYYIDLTDPGRIQLRQYYLTPGLHTINYINSLYLVKQPNSEHDVVSARSILTTLSFIGRAISICVQSTIPIFSSITHLRDYLLNDTREGIINGGLTAEDIGIHFRPSQDPEYPMQKTKEDAKIHIFQPGRESTTVIPAYLPDVVDFPIGTPEGTTKSVPKENWWPIGVPVPYEYPIRYPGDLPIPRESTTPTPEDGYEGPMRNPIEQPNPIVNPVINPMPNPIPYPQPVSNPQNVPTVSPERPENTPKDSGTTPIFVPPVADYGTGMAAIYHPTISELREFGSWLWGAGFDIDTFKKLFNNPMESIISLHKIYCSPVDAGRTTIRTGYINSNVPSNFITNPIVNIDCGWGVISEEVQNYGDYSPYTYARMYLPFVGFVTLNVDEIMNSAIHVIYKCNVVSGACVAEISVRRGTMEAVLYSFPGQITEPVPITGGTMQNVFAGVAGVVASVAATVATGGATAPLLVGAASSALSQKAHTEMVGNLSGNVGALSIKKPYIILGRQPEIKPPYHEFFAGAPAFNTVQLSQLSGYTKVSAIRFESARATQTDKEQIESLLQSGVIL